MGDRSTLIERVVMKAQVKPLVFSIVAFLMGCGESAKPPATDPESLKKLEELQKQAAKGEGGATKGKMKGSR